MSANSSGAKRHGFPSGSDRRLSAWLRFPPILTGDRGLAFYGDEREGIGPQDLFDGNAAQAAVRNLDEVASLCGRLLIVVLSDQTMTDVPREPGPASATGTGTAGQEPG